MSFVNFLNNAQNVVKLIKKKVEAKRSSLKGVFHFPFDNKNICKVGERVQMKAGECIKQFKINSYIYYIFIIFESIEIDLVI